MIRQTFTGRSGRLPVFLLLLVLSMVPFAPMASARASNHSTLPKFARRIRKALHLARETHAHDRYLWCVPFARVASGVDIHGNARAWWYKARDRYDRTHTPQVGDVMTFRPTRRIPLGHVAVVARVISRREILVNQANWHRNRVSLNMAVRDVSPHNDWTEVRVESYHHHFGSVYPVIGFIAPHAPEPKLRPIGLAMVRRPPTPVRMMRPELRPAVYYVEGPVDVARKHAPCLAPRVARRPRLRPAEFASTAHLRTASASRHDLAPRRSTVPPPRPGEGLAPVRLAADMSHPELRPQSLHG